MIKLKKFTKKLIGVGLSAAMLATTMFTGGTSAEAAGVGNLDGRVIDKEGEYLATFFASEYGGEGRNGFEIKFKYEPGEGKTTLDSNAKYSDTFEFLVFNESWGGWECTPVGPSGYDLEEDITPVAGKEYTVKVPFAAIESKLSSGSVQGINLQTGEIGTNKVTIVSLSYTEGVQKSEDVLITGKWHKTGDDAEDDFGSMKVNSGTAYVSPNAWNIGVSGFSVADFEKPIVAVTVNYEDVTKTIYPQSEILDTDYKPVKANYPQVSEDGNVTYLTYIPKDMTSMILAYDTCTVKTIEIYDEAEDYAEPITDLKNDTVIKAMGAGWNLGNALDAIKITEDENGKEIAVEDETAWGNPVVNKRLFKQVSAAEFKTVRIPVTWIGAVSVNGDNYTIDETQFERILGRTKEVVDMVIDYNMFAIINIQHDGGEGVTGQWLDIDNGNQTGIRKAFKEVWRRIATEFKDYDQHLIFESMNEVMEANNYDKAPKASTWTNINTLNDSFVKTVRDIGGGNTTRFLLMPGYNTDITQTIDGYKSGNFKIPTYNDSTEYEMISVHYYDPYNFTLNTGNGSVTNVTSSELDDIEDQFSALRSTFVRGAKVPVFVGEFGAVDKNNYSEIQEYTTKVVEQAKAKGLGYAYWDNGYTGEYGSGLWNRYTYAESTLGEKILSILAP